MKKWSLHINLDETQKHFFKSVKKRRGYLFLLQFLGIILFALSYAFSFCSFDSSYSSFSQYLVKKRKQYNDDFSFGKVVTTGGVQAFSSFYYTADDVPGNDLKNVNKTFFFSEKSDDFSPVNFATPGGTIASSVLEYTPWNFSDWHYGFTLLTNEEFSSTLARNETYITQSIADQILSLNSSVYKNYEDLVGKSIATTVGSSASQNLESVIIKGVISNDSLGDIGLTGFSNFSVFSYHTCGGLFDRITYYFLLYESSVSTTLCVKAIESGILASPTCSSFYFDKTGNGYEVGDTQLVKESTFKFYSSQSSIVCLVFAVAAVSALVGYLRLVILLFDFFPGRGESRSLSALLFLITLISYAITTLIICVSSPFVSGYIVFDFASYSSITLGFLVLVFLSIFTFISMDKSCKKTGNENGFVVADYAKRISLHL